VKKHEFNLPVNHRDIAQSALTNDTVKDGASVDKGWTPAKVGESAIQTINKGESNA
jgi:hypothetical protein